MKKKPAHESHIWIEYNEKRIYLILQRFLCVFIMCASVQNGNFFEGKKATKLWLPLHFPMEWKRDNAHNLQFWIFADSSDDFSIKLKIQIMFMQCGSILQCLFISASRFFYSCFWLVLSRVPIVCTRMFVIKYEFGRLFAHLQPLL